jgi:hypothetical protein
MYRLFQIVPCRLKLLLYYIILYISYMRLFIFSVSATQRGLWPPRSRGFVITNNYAPESVDSSGRVISSWQIPLTDNTQHTQQTNFHNPGGILTHDRSRRAAVDLRLRPRGHWDRFMYAVSIVNNSKVAPSVGRT